MSVVVVVVVFDVGIDEGACDSGELDILLLLVRLAGLLSGVP